MSSKQLIQVVVSDVSALTSDISRYRLTAVGAEPLPAFTAGAHIEIKITAELTRAYSLCSNPAHASDYYEIAVKKEAAGRGGSLAMHEKVTLGTTLTISEPKNHFALAEQASHHLLIAGGIGITPMMAMAHSLSAQQQPFTLAVCAAGEDQLPFAQTLRASNWRIHESLAGREHFDIAALCNDLPSDLHVYCCGPDSLTETVKAYCQTLPAAHYHEERFGALAPQTNADSVELYLSASDMRVTVPQGTSMISALRQAGIKIDSVCEQGICGSCITAWRDGEPEHHDQCLDAEDQAEYLAVCCAGCKSPSLTLEL